MQSMRFRYLSRLTSLALVGMLLPWGSGCDGEQKQASEVPHQSTQSQMRPLGKEVSRQEAAQEPMKRVLTLHAHALKDQQQGGDETEANREARIDLYREQVRASRSQGGKQ